MSTKIIFSSLLFLAGFIWSYIFVRQTIYNFTVANPVLKKMNAVGETLISPMSKKFLVVSVVANLLICGLIGFAVFYFCPLYLDISFLAGAIIVLVLSIRKLTYKNREMFDSFCATYYRFIPDDELRTAMYQKKPSQMKVRLHAMNLPYDFIPSFDKD